MMTTLEQLDETLAARKADDPNTSYVASLHHKGLNKILEKVGEETIEVVVAAKDAERTGKTKDVIAETADLWFHCLVMLSHLGLDHTVVLAELERRFGLSGIDEKANRNN